jgi:glycerol-3-phosphate dehydrogenase (NAD(P)+)
VGAGAWGTALAIHALAAGNGVSLVARDAPTCLALRSRRENSRLAGVRLPEALEITDRIPAAATMIIWAVPTRHMRTAMMQFSLPAVPMVICAKGLEAGSNLLPLEVAAAALPGCSLAVLSGPNFAHEVARGLPAAAVVASENTSVRNYIRDSFGTTWFRIYGNDDPIGTQVGGAGKNVIAIAAGAVIGAGLGENARAALVTRGLSELSRVAVALGGRSETVMGLSGLGDLLLTCTGPSSRNFSLGFALGQGRSLSEALSTISGVAEGVPAAAALVGRSGPTDIPICQAVASLLDGRITLNQAIAQLLSRPPRNE